VRDLSTSAPLLRRHGFPFLFSPQTADGSRRTGRPTYCYSDVLLESDFSTARDLGARIRAWLDLFRRLRPDLVVIDHAPVALIACRIAGLNAAALGTGFEIPPAHSPTPDILGYGVRSLARRQASDAALIDIINQVLRRFSAEPISSIHALFASSRRLLTTFRELDVHGPREDVEYFGPVASASPKPLSPWPDSEAKRLLAYVRPRAPGFINLVQALGVSGCEVQCIAPGATPSVIKQFTSSRMRIHDTPIDLIEALKAADGAICYGGAAFIAQSLQAGVPLLAIGCVPEQAMNARRVAALGAGIAVTAAASRQDFRRALNDLLTQDFAVEAQAFARRYPASTADSAAERIASALMQRHGRTAAAAS
jgi:hypothetical protein